MVGRLVHLTAVGVFHTEDIARELNNHHLHSETDAEGRYVVGSGIFCGSYLSFYSTLSETWTYQYSIHALYALRYILPCEIL